MIGEYIKDIEHYLPSRQSNEQLADDWRIVCAWLSTVRSGGALKYLEREIIVVASQIYKEMKSRIARGTMKHEFTTDWAREMIAEIQRQAENSLLEIYPGTDSKHNQPEILLTDFIRRLSDFYLDSNFIYIVGSLANYRKTTGDIDILINAPADSDIYKRTTFRIFRAFPTLQNRMHFSSLYDSHGPFTSHVVCYRLKAERVENPIIVDMSKFKPGEFFFMQKPQHGREINQSYSPDNLIPVVEKTWIDWRQQGIFVSKKCDGVTCQVHRIDNKVKIITEQNQDITNNLPSLINEILKIPHNFVIIGELEKWKDNKHYARAETSGIINHLNIEEEKNIHLTIYDIFYFDGKELFTLAYKERRSIYERLETSKRINIYDEREVFTEDEIRTAVKKYSSMNGSEGAMLKLSSAPYLFSINPPRPSMIKFKNEYQLTVKVIHKQKVKNAEAWVYSCALADADYVGDTYNTSIKANIDDHIIVSFVDIIEYKTKDHKTWFNFWAPHAIGSITNKPLSTSADAHEIVSKTTGKIEQKELTKLSWTDEHSEIENAEKRKYVVQAHFRGNSVHFDFRVENDKGSLDGFTMLVQKENEIKGKWRLTAKELFWNHKPFYLTVGKDTREVATQSMRNEIEKWYQEIAKDSNNFKLNVSTGQQKARPDQDNPNKSKIECVEKEKEPNEWLNVLGLTDARIVEPEPGGTQYFPGCFVEIDKGNLFLGAQKTYFKEFFLDGKWQGRIVFRQLTLNNKFTWLYWKPDDQTPYVFSDSATKEEWLPNGYSALPASYEYKLSPSLNYWDANIEKKKRLERRQKAAEFFKETNSVENSSHFSYSKMWYKGQTVIRNQPIIDFFLSFADYCFRIDNDIIYKDSTAEQIPYLEKYFTPAILKPETTLNPNKKIPAFIELIEKGNFNITSKTDKEIEIIFYGRQLAGKYIIIKEKKSNYYMIKKI